MEIKSTLNNTTYNKLGSYKFSQMIEMSDNIFSFLINPNNCSGINEWVTTVNNTIAATNIPIQPMIILNILVILVLYSIR